MPRKPPRSTEERLVRAQKSMMPGTLGGRVASAAPMALDVTRLDPRLRANPSTGGGGGFDPNADPVVIGLDANAEGGTESVIIGKDADNFGGDGGCVAIGPTATVSAYAGTAVGPDSNARGQRSTALGNSPAAQGTDDVCIGQGGSTARSTSTAGQRNIAIGKFAVTSFAYPAAAASNCIAIGSFAEADAWGSVAIGAGAYAFDHGGSMAGPVAIGSNAYTTGDDGTAVGPSTQAAGANSSAFGAGADSHYINSTAIGAYAVCDDDHQIILGTDNEYVTIPRTLVMKSPDDSRWRITVDNSGTVTVAPF